MKQDITQKCTKIPDGLLVQSILCLSLMNRFMHLTVFKVIYFLRVIIQCSETSLYRSSLIRFSDCLCMHVNIPDNFLNNFYNAVCIQLFPQCDSQCNSAVKYPKFKKASVSSTKFHIFSTTFSQLLRYSAAPSPGQPWNMLCYSSSSPEEISSGAHDAAHPCNVSALRINLPQPSQLLRILY